MLERSDLSYQSVSVGVIILFYWLVPLLIAENSNAVVLRLWKVEHKFCNFWCPHKSSCFRLRIN